MELELDETIKKLREIALRKRYATDQLVGPAKAAYNAMMDAGMKRTADPLGEALVKLQAGNSEFETFIAENPKAAIESMIEMMKNAK